VDAVKVFLVGVNFVKFSCVAIHASKKPEEIPLSLKEKQLNLKNKKLLKV